MGGGGGGGGHGWAPAASQAQTVEQVQQDFFAHHHRLYLQRQHQALTHEIQQRTQQLRIAQLQAAAAARAPQAQWVWGGHCAPAVEDMASASAVLLSGIAPHSLTIPGATT
uniref:Uncharacterized protein n=1 Tax=Hemiselmis andersenii TaxID=464988 RepID=A0A7S0Y1U1_HEMAN